MTIWLPDLSHRSGPRYVSIADAIAADIASGRLAPGTRLPTHRDLAYRLGVTVGTVSRAYAEAERRGLIGGEVGRGTFVRDPERRSAVWISETVMNPDPGLIDLSRGNPVAVVDPALLAESLASIVAAPEMPSLLRYGAYGGRAAHLAAGAAWLTHRGLPTKPEQIVVTAGAIHALLVAFMSLAQHGDVVLVEALTYPGFKELAARLGLRLHGVTMDQEGIDPDAFEAACRSTGARLAYLMPTLHNPTLAVLSEERRRRIADTARQYGVTIVEDDVHGFLVDAPPPTLAALAPERTYHVVSVSKCLNPSLRIGFLRAPEGLADRLAPAIRASMGMAPPLMAELVSRWINDGTAATLTERQREHAAERQKIARRLLGNHPYVASARSPWVWLPLPDPWRTTEFTAEARRRGLGLAPTDAFVVGRGAAPHAVRVSLSNIPALPVLERGLTILADLLAEPCPTSLNVV